LLYVGALRAEKGLPEAIAALGLLRDGGLEATLTIAGGGEVAAFQAQWRGLGLAGAVRFAGVLPNQQIIPLMRQHDVVLVTSRHDYPEGFPMTITEALCARTPLVLSDHPMFGLGIAQGEGATFFRAGDAADLAGRLARLLGDPAAYCRLSQRSLAALQKLHCPVTWGQVIDRFLGNTPADRDWFGANALAALEQLPGPAPYAERQLLNALSDE
jgi:glycosyltransferase involved in cell wall biosynthesis